jgi:uncharacterized protein
MSDGQDGSALCLACGLCCNGVLFGSVRLTPSEAARMTSLGLPFYSPTDHAAMLQPCAALEGTACRVYAERPMRCISYRCHLLEAFEADELDFAEALGVVTLAKELEGVQQEQFVELHFHGRSQRRR